MSIGSITAVVILKSLWWIVPSIGVTAIMAVVEANEEV